MSKGKTAPKIKKANAPKSKIMANPSPEAAERRRKLFAERYLVNGNNATEAAKFAGFAEHTAYVTGSKLLRHPEVIEMLGNRMNEVLTRAKLTTERWAAEMAAIGHFDIGELYDEDGKLIPVHKLPEHVRRAISGVDVATDEDGVVTSKIRMNDKNTALTNIGKHLGMFEKDNSQLTKPLQIAIQILD